MKSKLKNKHIDIIIFVYKNMSTNLEKVFNNDKRFEDYAAKHTDSYTDIEKALEIVKEFILKKNLIIYGGMAIDLALKAKKHKGIYKDDVVPDYDFMSPNHYMDACELADILHSKGFKDVQAVNAVHVSTYKVRTNFVWVADITYYPLSVYKTVPTLTVNGFRIVHPDFQRMDVHRAMSTPYEKPPMEVFLNRTRKDQKRFRMLAELYPLEDHIKEKSTNQISKIVKVPIELYKDNVIGGAQAYCVMWTSLNEILNGNGKLAKSVNLAENISDIRKKFKSLPKGEFSVEGNNLVFNSFSNVVNIITDDFETVLNKVSGSKNAKYYNKYVDEWRPRTVVSGEYEIFDNKSRLLPSYDIKNINAMLTFLNKNVDNVKVCLPQYVLMYFLQKYFGGGFTDNGDLDKSHQLIFIKMYIATEELIIIAETLYKALIDKMPAETVEVTNKIFAELPFFLTDKVYGSTNWSPDYIVGVRKDNYFINYVPIDKQVVMKPPNGYYLKEKPKPFDYSKSDFFQFDGQACAPFKPIELMTDFSHVKTSIDKNNLITPPASPNISKKMFKKTIKKRFLKIKDMMDF